jgi:predicted transcriptional regulator
MTQNSPLNYLELATDLVSAYVSHNALPPSDLPSLIDAVHAALTRASSGAVEQGPEAPRPPVPIKTSITSDYLISLEDGTPYRSLTRHLAKRGLTPDQPVDEVVVPSRRWSQSVVKTIRAGPALFSTKTSRMAA